MKPLTWKKLKSGQRIARTFLEEVYLISLRTDKWGRDFLVLTKDGKFVWECPSVPAFKRKRYFETQEQFDSHNRQAEEAVKVGRENCKEVAELVHQEVHPVLKRVLKTLPKRRRPYYVDDIEDVFQLHRLPEVELPRACDKIRKKAIDSPHRCLRDILKEEDIPLTQQQYDNLFVQTFWARVDYAAKEHTQWINEQEVNEARQRFLLETNAAEAIVATPEVEKPYRGPLPEERSRDGLSVLSTYTASEALPFVLKSAKWSDLYKWAEKIRDYFQINGKFVTAAFLSGAAHSSLWNYLSPAKDGVRPVNGGARRAEKAEKRILSIYSTEWSSECAKLSAEIRYAYNHPTIFEPGATKKAAAGKDKWGYRIGTRAAAVNEVIGKKPRSEKWIRKKVGSDVSVSSHLSSLVKKKLVKKVDGKYRLRRTKK